MPITAAEPVETLIVVAGILCRDDQVLIAQRPLNKHQGGRWEFPGGKQETGETALQALQRELQEEIGIAVLAAEPFLQISHRYPEKQVELAFWRVTDFQGEPEGREGQALCWVSRTELHHYTFPEANLPVVQRLQGVGPGSSPG